MDLVDLTGLSLIVTLVAVLCRDPDHSKLTEVENRKALNQYVLSQHIH